MAHEQPRRDVDIFWDFGSSPAPFSTSGYTVVNLIRALALRLGIVKSFRAYLSVSDHNLSLGHNGGGRAPILRSELQSSGVSLIDAPGTKDIADKMLIVDVFACAFDRGAYSQSNGNNIIMLIAGDPSFSYLLSVLRMRNHRVVVLGTGGGPDDYKNNSAPLAPQANLWLDWNTEILDNIRVVIPHSTTINSALQTTENLNSTPRTKISESKGRRASEDASEMMQAGSLDHRVEANSTTDSLDGKDLLEEADSQQPIHQSAVEERPAFKLNPHATAWQWDPTARAKSKNIPSPLESEDLPQVAIANLTPPIPTPSTEEGTDSLHKPQPRYADCDWEVSFNSTKDTQTRETTLVDSGCEESCPTRPSSAEPSEKKLHAVYDWPPPQATRESSSSPQNPSRPGSSNPPEYFPGDGSEGKVSISRDGITYHFRNSTSLSFLVASELPSLDAPDQIKVVVPPATSTQPTSPSPAAAPESTSASPPSESFDGVAPHFQHLIHVLRDFRSQGVTGVDRGRLFPPLQKRDRNILVAAGTAQYRNPFVLYIEDAHEAGVITSPTGKVELVPRFR